MNGVIVAEPIVIADEGSHLLSITSTGSAKVVITSSGIVRVSDIITVWFSTANMRIPKFI